MKVFEIQLKNPNHPTGARRRDGEVFKTNRKVYAEKISEAIAADKCLKISEVEPPKGADVLEKIGTAPYIKPGTEKPEGKPKEEKKAGPGLLGKIIGKSPVQAIPPVPGLPEKKD